MKLYLKPLEKININYSGRSGSFFLHKLLDGHSRIITFHPEYDLYVYQVLKIFYLRKLPLNDLSIFLSNELEKKIKQHLILPTSSKINIDMKKIYESIKIQTKNDSSLDYDFDDLIDLFFLSHAKLNLDYINFSLPYILMQTHEAFEYEEKNFFFKNVNLKILYLMMRDPVKSLDSHYYHLRFENNVQINSSTLFSRILIDFKKSTDQLSDSLTKKKTHVICYENLHNLPKKTLSSVLKKLDLKCEVINFKETISGINSDSFKKLSGETVINFRKVTLPENTKILNNLEILIIEKLFKKIIVRFDYKFRILSKNNLPKTIYIVKYILNNLLSKKLYWKCLIYEIKNFMKIMNILKFRGVSDKKYFND